MLTTLPESPHYTVDEIGTSQRFAFPYCGGWWCTASLLFLAPVAWLWFIIIIVAFTQIENLEASVQTFAILGLVLLLMLILPLVATLDLLWHLIGKEIVEINDDHIVVRHHIFGLGIAITFRSNDVHGLFVSRLKTNWLKRFFSGRQVWYFNFKQGKIAFNCGKHIFGGVKTFRFGTSLDEAEVTQIVSLIHKRFPQYIYTHQR